MTEILGKMILAVTAVTIIACIVTGSALPIVWGGIALYSCLYGAKYVNDRADA